jgi:tetratricopeptide (TPR) repeat protein
MLSECYYKMDQCEYALDQAKIASEAYRSDEDVQHLETLRGKCLDRLKQYQEAVAAYQSALVVAVSSPSEQGD